MVSVVADFLISEDQDLLVLGTYAGARIITTVAYLDILLAEDET
jgi:hypothetical protein